jgi:hypothetical protein
MINENLGASPDQAASAAASGPGLEPGASLKLAPPPPSSAKDAAKAKAKTKAKAETYSDEPHKTWGHLDRRFSLSAVLSTVPGFGSKKEGKMTKNKPKAKG